MLFFPLSFYNVIKNMSKRKKKKRYTFVEKERRKIKTVL